MAFSLKKLLKSAGLAIASVGMLLATVSQSQAASAATYVRTNGSCLTVRQYPSMNAQSVGCVSNGSPLKSVVGYKNGYARLTSGNYVSAEWISSTSSLGVGSPVNLTIGSKGRAVRQVQTALGIRSDGVYGPSTERHVRQFQRNSDYLAVDGIVGPKTRYALSTHTD